MKILQVDRPVTSSQPQVGDSKSTRATDRALRGRGTIHEAAAGYQVQDLRCKAAADCRRSI